MRWETYERLRLECLNITNQVLMQYNAWIKSHSGLKRS